MAIPYSAEKDDLYYPAKHAVFFPNDRPHSDAALCVEMARLAYCQLDTSFAFDQDRIRKVLGRIQFTDCKFFETAAEPDGRGSHAFLALDGKNKLAVLSFRGTNKDDPSDLSDDFNAIPQSWPAGGKVHSGFGKALKEVWPGVEAALQELNEYQSLFTGHSLGAAMATLASSLKRPKSLYTIGSPRVGDQTFVDKLQGLDNHRYVDCCDLVTRVPPEEILGLKCYAHIPGKIHYIDFNRAVKDLDPNDSVIKDDRRKAEEDYLENYAWRIGDLALRPLADHAPVNYVLPVTAATP
jgi:Lipase (class 3)